MIGQTVSHYRITRQLGAGGMGVVYEAVDRKLDRKVALKFLPPESTRDREAKARFIREAKTASALDHPNVCTIHEIDETDDGQLFIVMACYEGETLKDRIARGPLPVDAALDIARQVGLGLARAHESGIVHRDVKPANIFLTVDGQVKVVDFGLAKLGGQTQITRDGSTLGTAAYMSPEQSRGEDTDARADVWSLGAVLYEMLTGKRPFKGDTLPAMIHAVQNDDPAPVSDVRAEVPADISRVVAQMLAKDPDVRYQKVDTVTGDLERFGAGQPLAVATMPLPGRRTDTRRRVFLGLATAVVLAAVGIFWYSQWRDSGRIEALAVLPFANISGDEEREFFADGMTDALITELQKLGGDQIRVIGRTSVMRYKDSDLSLPEIAAELGVDVLVEGTVTSANELVKVAAKLIQADPEQQMWARSYDRKLQNILALHADVARAVAEELKLILAPDEDTRQVDPEAYEAYLMGKHIVDSSGDVYKALPYFERAVEIDSTFAPAWAKMAHCKVMPEHGWPFDPANIEVARRFAEKAIELDQTHAEGYSVLGHILWEHDWDFARANEMMEKSLALNPNDGVAWSTYGFCLWAQARYDEAADAILNGLKYDPFNWLLNLVAPWPLSNAERHDEALAQIERSQEIFPNFDLDGRMVGYHAARKEYDKAIEYHEKSRPEPADGDTSITIDTPGYAEYIDGLMNLLFRKGEVDSAMVLREQVRQTADVETVRPFSAAAFYAGVDDDSTFIWLEKAYEQRDLMLTRLRYTRYWDETYGDDPRYQDLLRRLNLAD